MQVRTFTGGGFGENAYLAVCESSGACVAIDPGADAPRLVRAIESEGFDLRAVLLTHAHLDHIEGVGVVRDFAPEVAIWLHPDDLQLYRRLPESAAYFGLQMEAQPEPTDWLEPGQRFEFGECTFDVRFAPGHAPGHVIFVEADAGIAFVGDVVFQGSIGRTDLPGGDFQTLMKSIREEVLTLPDETMLYTGHGPATTVGRERAMNPFLVQLQGGELA